MRRLQGAVFWGVLVLLLGPGVARADPRFALIDVEARAGDNVRFTISGTDARASYVLELRDQEVARGTAPAEAAIAGAFTMPDLGANATTVIVEAKVTESDETTEIERTLRYLLPAPAPPPIAAAPAPAPTTAAAPQPLEPQPARRPGRRGSETDRPRKRRTPARGRKRTVSGDSRLTTARKRTPGKRGKGNPVRRSVPRTAPLFDGVPEGPPGRGLPAGGSGGPLVLNAIAPPTALLGTDAAAGQDSGGPPLSLLVPLFAGLAALLLAGTALLRSRRARPAADSSLATLDRVARSGDGLRRGLARRMRRR